MKSLTMFFLALALCLTADNANAISLRYKFKVFSSGPIIYACNAGVMYEATNKQVCYFQGTNQVCSPDDCSTTSGNCNSSCVCSSSNGGDYLMNYGKADYQDFKDHGDTSSTGKVVGKSFSSTSGANVQLFSDAASWSHRIENLEFNLGSELYTGKYWLDICYRGPQIEYQKDGVATNYTLWAQTAAENFVSNGKNPGENDRTGLVMGQGNYLQLAGVTAQAFTVCDSQGVGSFSSALNNSDQANTDANEAEFTYDSNGMPNGAREGSGSFWSSTAKTVSGSISDLIKQSIVTNSGKSPRFCKIRYVFTETNWKATSPNLRRWLKHGAEMCTYTSITEGAPF